MKIIAIGLICVAGAMTTPTLRGSETTIPDDNPGRAKAIAWLRANSKGGAQSPLISDSIKIIDEALMKDGIVQLTLGPDRLKSGRPTGLWLIDEEFFSFEFTPQQGQQIGIKSNDAQVKLFPQIEELNGLHLFEISKLRVDNAEHVDGAKPICGAVACKALVKTAEREFSDPLFPAANWRSGFELRLWYVTPGADTPTISLYHPWGYVPAHGAMHFSFLPFNADDRLKQTEVLDQAVVGNSAIGGAPAKKVIGPVVVFATICAKVKRESPPVGSRGLPFALAEVVCSNVTAQLVNVEETAAADSP